MPNIQLLSLKDENKLFSRVAPLVNITIPKDIDLPGLMSILGNKDTSSQKWVFVYENVPMKIQGGILTTYKDKEFVAKRFILDLKETLSESKKMKKEADEKKKKINGDDIIINPDDKYLEIK